MKWIKNKKRGGVSLIKKISGTILIVLVTLIAMLVYVLVIVSGGMH